MIDNELFIVVFLVGILMLSIKLLMEWQLYKFNKSCDLKIKHLRLKERYEMIKRLTK